MDVNVLVVIVLNIINSCQVIKWITYTLPDNIISNITAYTVYLPTKAVALFHWESIASFTNQENGNLHL